MALSYDIVTALTQKKFIPKLYDNIFDTLPVLKKLKEKSYEKLDGGERIVVPLNYAKNSQGGWYQASETLSVSDADQVTAAEYTWKLLETPIIVTGLDERKNSGDSQVISLVKSKVQIAEKSMMDFLGTGVFSDGSDAESIVGLSDIVATDQTVGGISQTTYTWWAGQVDSTTTTLSLGAMQSRYNACLVNADHTDLIATTRTLFNSFFNLLQPQQRFMNAGTAKAGFENLMFNGAEVLPDSYCPASNMFFLNTNYIHLFVHKDCDMYMEPFQKPVNQDIKVARILWTGAMGSSNNRLHGRLSAVTS